MKKYLSLISIFSVLTLCSCNFQIPKSVSVRTNAEYNFTIADFSYDLSEKFSLSSLLGDSEGEDSAQEEQYKIYEYNPNGSSDIQQFLLQMDIQEIPLAFDEYLQQTDYFSFVENMNFQKEISIPNKMDFPVDFDIDVNERVNSLVTFGGIIQEKTDLAFSFVNNDDGFESISYKSGKMIISNIEIPDIGIDIPFIEENEKIKGSVQLYYLDKKISEATFDSNGVAYLSLDNVTIYRDGMTLKFNTEKYDTTYMGRISSDSVVKSANGITISDAVSTTIETTASMKDAAALESCKVEEGEIKLNFEMPEQWTGLIFDYEVTISGGLTVDKSEFIDNTIDLAGKTFTTDDWLVRADITLTLKDADIQFIDEQGKSINPLINAAAEIKKIDYATVKLDEEFIASIEKQQALPDEALDVIKELKWNQSGVIINYTNTLPPENEIKVRLSSEFFGMEETEVTIETTTESEAKKLEFLCEEDTLVVLGKNPGEFSEFDVKANVTFSGYDDEKKTFTIYNVEAGKDYKIGFEIQPKIDWKSISLNSSLANQNGEISTGLNISSMFKGMEDAIGSNIMENVDFEKLPLYLFCNIPELENCFETPKFTGKIKAFFGDDDCKPVTDAEDFYLLGSETEIGELPSIKMPALQLNKDNVVISNLSADLVNYEGINLAPLLNNSNTDGSLCVNYDVGFQTGKDGEITITSAAFDKLGDKGSASIKLSAIVIVPLNFLVREQLEMDVLKMIGKDTAEENFDLLGRTEAPDFTEIQKYLDAVESVTVDYQSSKLPFKFEPVAGNDSLKLLIDLDGSGTEFENEELYLRGDQYKKNPSALLNIYPLNPTLTLAIPQGKLSIPRSMEFATKINLKIETNGTVKIFEGGNN